MVVFKYSQLYSVYYSSWLCFFLSAQGLGKLHVFGNKSPNSILIYTKTFPLHPQTPIPTSHLLQYITV